MLTKLIAIAFVALLVGRVLFRPRLAELGRWFSGVVDTTLIVIAVVYGVQLAIMLSR